MKRSQVQILSTGSKVLVVAQSGRALTSKSQLFSVLA